VDIVSPYARGSVSTHSRKIKLRVRPGHALYGPGFSYGAGDEFVVPIAEAATLLKGTGRRSFDIVEVIDDPPADATRGWRRVFRAGRGA
jgi:hypothetical protein